MIEINIPKEFLVVDDSLTIRNSLKKYLKKAFNNCIIHEASTGKEAIKQMAQNKIHLIITDLNMPELSGDKFIEKLINNKTLSKKPIIVFSSEDMSELKEKFKDKSNVIFMFKPSTTQDEIISQVKIFLKIKE